MQWTFNLARVPWCGGVLERTLQMPQDHRESQSLDDFTTLLAEVGIINFRPISYISSNDTEGPLTPVHLLFGRRLLSLPDLICHTDPEEEYGHTREHLTRRLVNLNKLVTFGIGDRQNT